MHINKVVDTSFLKILGCLHTSFTDKIPNSQSVQLMHKPKNKETITIGNISGGKKVKLYERKEDPGAMMKPSWSPKSEPVRVQSQKFH